MAGKSERPAAKIAPQLDLSWRSYKDHKPKPHVEAETVVLAPLVPFSGKAGTLTFDYTVPKNCSFAFCRPALMLECRVRQMVGTTATGLAATKRMIFDAPFAFVNAVRCNLNGNSLSLGYPQGEVLRRLIALDYRTTTNERLDAGFLEDALRLPTSKADMATDAKEQSSETAERIQFFVHDPARPTVILPVRLPFWPFENPGAHSRVTGVPLDEYQVKAFTENTQIVVHLGVQANDAMGKYVRQLVASAEKLPADNVQVQVTDVHLLGKLWRFPAEHPYLASYRTYAKSAPIMNPFIAQTAVEWELNKGLSEIVQHFNANHFDTSWFVLYWREYAADDGGNVTDFKFPANISRLQISCGTENLAATPLEQFGSFQGVSKFPFFTRQARTRLEPGSMVDFYSQGLQQFVVVDLTNMRARYKKQLVTSMPDVVITTSFNESKSPESTVMGIVSYKTGSVTINAHEPTSGQVTVDA